VLYHREVADDAAAVRELARVLRPGGQLLLRVPALRLLRRRHDQVVHGRRRYTRAEVAALLRQAGLEIARLSYCNTLLLPLVAARAALDRFGGGDSELGRLPASVERWFAAGLRGEARLIARVDLPLGASVIALGRKP